MASNRKPRIHPGPTIIKTMFYIEGNPVASLLTNNGGIRQNSIMEFLKAEDALDWCRHHACTFVYSPVDVLQN